MTIAELPISIDYERVAKFCRERGIKRLSLFGSVLREDFAPHRSDIDVLVEFFPNAIKGVGFRYFGYEDELSKIFGHKVDLCSRLNEHIADAVHREAVPIYEQA
jgi:uncharacterized protein